MVSFGQNITIDAQIKPAEIRTGHLKMGNPGSAGKELEANNKYLTLGGKAIIPIMGEIHPTRVNAENWEESILKMKANGINIIAFYIFWIHHEETEGNFNWTGNNNIRNFVELCKKHNVWAYPRLGPWCHGEVRNGGIPDWLMEKKNLKLRSNDGAYQFYADRFYHEIGKQLSVLYYKDNGPIVGVQLENEYWRGKGGESHILWLKETAQKYGIDVPMYTVTGWRSASVPENEVIPLWGGYPAAPWNTDVKKINRNESYLFKKPLNDESIGHKENNDRYSPDYSPYPYLTCELGVGNQISDHRRPIIDPIDGMTIALSNIASGSNLPGYYVFTGGLNPVGKYTTLEEDRLESGYWNEYPDISYDFQAAISEAGEIMPAYHQLKPLHYFLNDFGHLLAPMQPVIPSDNEDWNDLQYSFRTNGNSGFVFVSNYYRGQKKETKKDVQFTIQLNDETIQIPQKAVDIPDSAVFIWPVNLNLGNALLKQATTQLICCVQNGNTTTWFFKECRGITSNYIFATENIQQINYQKKTIQSSDNTYQIQDAKTGLSTPILITMENKDEHRIITLSEDESRNFWHFKQGNETYVFLSSANLFIDDQQQLHAFSTNKTDTLIALTCKLKNESTNAAILEKTNSNIQQFIITNPKEEFQLSLKKADLIDSVQWLSLSPLKYDEKYNMYHKQFFKDFTLSNTAEIRKAGIYLLSGQSGKIRINKHWVNQNFVPNELCYLDLTGYLQVGENNVLFDFPYSAESNPLGALIEIEYFNSNKEYLLSDTTWLTIEQYKIPAPWDEVRNKRTPEIQSKPNIYGNAYFLNNRYSMNMELPKVQTGSNLYLRINYNGNKAQCRMGDKLVADNFNNGSTWTINLNNRNIDNKQPLIFELEPWEKDQLIYLDKYHDQVMCEKPEIINMKTEREYKTIFTIVTD